MERLRCVARTSDCGFRSLKFLLHLFGSRFDVCRLGVPCAAFVAFAVCSLGKGHYDTTEFGRCLKTRYEIIGFEPTIFMYHLQDLSQIGVTMIVHKSW